ncbi:cupin domain-containing protein [Nesterenkonia alkaliphila]|uniref:Cupin domain-containing protein n=1 Tax=Nesterenkonia alkaliphila TaxID=1463631 RepID=A0A7K1UH11_9MICC|nr:cupin domain-containing protein [Nesterenkonia alkaliphila]MVT25760.1 cupin domain-containing protein [Nesterenkonia alkaliphila]GFZ93079.1 cupin [Nesterenkonia alkaliphila]
MITVTTREDLKAPDSQTALFEGKYHSSGVTFFWVDTPPGTGPEAHWHPYTETWAVIEGEVEVLANGETVHGRTGDIITVTAETVHQFRNIGADSLKMMCIHASPELIEHEVD